MGVCIYVRYDTVAIGDYFLMTLIIACIERKRSRYVLATTISPILHLLIKQFKFISLIRSNSLRIGNLYKKYVGRQLTLAWKRVTMSTRKPERTSMFIEGFDIINSKRRTIYFGKPGAMPTSIPIYGN